MTWIVRAVLTIGLACLAVPSPAQQDSSSVLNELMRKGMDRDSEDGICASTRWPVYAPAELLPRYKQWLAGAGVGGEPWRWRSPTGCTTAIVERAGTSGGGPCLRTRTFVCSVGGSCTSTPGDWCPVGNGDFRRCNCE